VAGSGGDTPGLRARLWDAPVRIGHWLIVLLAAAAWFTAEIGRMELHRRCGYGVLGLVLFRLYWGFAGSESARFASFLKGPRAVAAYARTLGRRAPSETAGHNPLGAWSVAALLAALAAEAGFGLFAVDVDGIESGPLSRFVDFDAGRRAAALHALAFTALQALVVLHLAAAVFYLAYKRQDLIGPMITGRRRFAVDPDLKFAPAWRAAAGALAAAALVWFVARGLRM
jgi:cytochrome b